MQEVAYVTVEVIPGWVMVVVEVGELVIDAPPPVPVPVPDPVPVTPATLPEAPVEMAIVGKGFPADAPVTGAETPLGRPEPPVTALPRT